MQATLLVPEQNPNRSSAAKRFRDLAVDVQLHLELLQDTRVAIHLRRRHATVHARLHSPCEDCLARQCTASMNTRALSSAADWANKHSLAVRQVTRHESEMD